MAQLAHDEAAAYYRSALDLLGAAGSPASALRQELLVCMGEAQGRAGDSGSRDTLLAAARVAQDRGDAPVLARAARPTPEARFRSGARSEVVDAERIETLEAALAMLPTGDSTTRARLLAALGQALLYAGDRERRVLLSREAVDMARRLGEPATLAYVLLERFFAIVAPSTLGERLVESAELLSLAEALGDPTMTAQALIIHVRNNAEAGRVEEADRHLEAAEQSVTELGQPTLRWFVGNSRVVRTLLAGDLAEGERLVHANFEEGQATGQADADGLLHQSPFPAPFRAGTAGGAGATGRGRHHQPPHVPCLPGPSPLRVGSFRRSPSCVRAAGRYRFRRVPVDNAWMQAMPSCAMVAARLGDRRAAVALYGLLVPYGDQFVFAYGGAWGALAHYLGLLATTLDRFEEAEARFAAAAATHERIGAPAWLARTRCEWAAMLLRRGEPGDAERARHLLDQALVTARDLGLASVERQAVEYGGA